MSGHVPLGRTLAQFLNLNRAPAAPPAQPAAEAIRRVGPSVLQRPDRVVNLPRSASPRPLTLIDRVPQAPAGVQAIAQGVWYGVAAQTADGADVRVLTMDPRQARLGAAFGTGLNGVSHQQLSQQPRLVGAINGTFYGAGVIGDMQGLGRTYRDESAPTSHARTMDSVSDGRYFIATTQDGQILTGRGGLSETRRSDIDGFQGGLGVLYTRPQLASLDQDIRSGRFAERIIFRRDAQTPTIARSFAGVTADGQLMLVTMGDGQHRSQGASFTEAARIMRSLGAVEAYILDGGGSTSMVVPGVAETRTDGRSVKGYLAIYAAR